MLDTQEYGEIFGSLQKFCFDEVFAFDYYEASHGIHNNSLYLLQNYTWEKHIGIGFWWNSQKINEIDTFLHT